MDTASFHRLFIRCSLRERGLDTDTVTEGHRPLFDAVGVEATPGTDLDAALRGLNRDQASSLCRQLRSKKQ